MVKHTQTRELFECIWPFCGIDAKRINWKFLWRLPIQNHSKLPIFEKRQNETKYQSQISHLKFRKTWVCKEGRLARPCQKPWIHELYSPSSPRPNKSHSNFIRYNWRSVVDQENLKPHWKSEKRPHFSRWSTSLLFTSFSKTSPTKERRLTKRQFLAARLSQTFLNTETTNETFQQSGKQYSLTHILKSSANMYECSGSLFFLEPPLEYD